MVATSTLRLSIIGVKPTFKKVSLKVARNAAKAATASMRAGFCVCFVG
jgi:hypothetical protein